MDVRDRWQRLVGVGLTVVLAAAGLVVTTPSSASAAAPGLLSDDFEDGDAAGWRTTGGRWSVVADEAEGRVLQQGSTSASTRARTGHPSWADYSVSARVKTLAPRALQSSVGILARVQADGSHYYLASRSDDTVELGRMTGGRTTALATASYPSYAQVWRDLKLVVRGNTLIGLVNGTAKLRATDSRLAGGSAGLATWQASAHFDDVVVESYAPTTPDTQAPVPPVTVQVLAVTPTTATISWTPTIDNVGVTGYVLYRGDGFSGRADLGTVSGTGPITVPLSPTAVSMAFLVAARDAAGNVSAPAYSSSIPQPPSFAKTGTDTVPPTAPGVPRLSGRTADGRSIVTWAPAIDNVGVVEYHLILTTDFDYVRVLAKSGEPTVTATISGGYPMLRVIAYDASWNGTSGPSSPFGGWPAPSSAPSAPVG
jgi:hypothetical protein